MSAPLFKVQAAKWLASGTDRKRDPWRKTTADTYASQIANVLPLLADKPIDQIGNAVLREVAAKLVEKGLKPTSVQHAVDRAKQVRESCQDGEGQRLYPIDWNNDIIFQDVPTVDRSKQRTPVASLPAVEEAIKKASPDVAALIALLAGTGMRIKELLAITTSGPEGNLYSADASMVIVTGQRIAAPTAKQVFGPTKTTAGVREIDLAPELNKLLQNYVKSCSENPLGLLFPMSEAHYRDELNALLPGGFHALRRARVTYIRLNGVPQALVDYWTGHGAGTMSEIYTKVGAEIEARRQHAIRVGLGFNLSVQFCTV